MTERKRRGSTKAPRVRRSPPRPTAPAQDKVRGLTPASAPFSGFDHERATYERHKAELLTSEEGRYVVIRGDELVGPLETYGEALRAGYTRFGLDHPFFVKQVLAVEPVVTVTRDILPCPA